MPQVMLKTGAIVPAAGLASRMGECKATMEIEGKPALTWIVTSLRESGIDDVTVVTGHWRDQVEPLARALNCSTVHNPEYMDGMFSSAKKGIKSIPQEWDRFFFLPVDVPLVRPSTLSRLTEEEGSLVYPRFMGKRGHPPLIHRSLIDQILSWDGEMGLRGALESLEPLACDVTVIDQGIGLDMDRPEDHRYISSLATRRDLPTDVEIKALEALAGTPENVLRHEMRVTQTAMEIATILKEKGIRMDKDLLRAAALLHDLCRTEKKHGLAGAELLRSQGFFSVARLVATHMDHPYDGTLDEGTVLYLADKLTCNDGLCSIDQRLAGMMAKFKGDEKAQEGAVRRLKKAQTILDHLSDILGCNAMEVLR